MTHGDSKPRRSPELVDHMLQELEEFPSVMQMVFASTDEFLTCSNRRAEIRGHAAKLRVLIREEKATWPQRS